MIRVHRLIGISLSLICGASSAWGQAHEPNPEAVKAFEKMVEAYRERPNLAVTTSVKVKMQQGESIVEGGEQKAEIVFTQKGQKENWESRDFRGLLKVNGFTCWLGEGKVTAIHEKTDHSYFSVEDDGSPFYTLTQLFVDLPFPHLALMLGEESIEDLCMQFHPKAPWILPTASGEKELEGETFRFITLTSDNATVEVLIDPKTELMKSVVATITAGAFVQPGTTLIYRHEFEYEPEDQPFDTDRLAFDPGNRQHLDYLMSLIPTQTEMHPATPQGPGNHQPDLVGKPAPEVVLESATGEMFDLDDQRGTVIVLDFWATWCGPCRKALPELHKIADWAKEEKLSVKIYTVNVWERGPKGDGPDARLEAAQNFWTKQNFTLPVLMDYSDGIGGAYGVTGIPTTVVIDPEGIVRAIHTGFSGDQLKADIQQALEEAAEPK